MRFKEKFTRAVLKIHWALGISIGLVLMVTGTTGATMSFEDEIMRAASPGVVTIVVPESGARLSPDALVAAIKDQQPERQIRLLILSSRPEESDRVFFTRSAGSSISDARSYVDPYTGRLLGNATGERFFETVRALHRWLLLPGSGNGPGRQITGATAICLVFFAVSGLWLRWPRRPLDWRQWLVLDFRRSGRALYRSLHVTIGGWLVVFYLTSVLTGLWWSFDWYRAGAIQLLSCKVAASEGEDATNAAQKGRARGKAGGDNAAKPVEAKPADADAVGLGPAWATIHKQTNGSYRSVTITFQPGKPALRVQVLPIDARHDRAFDEYRIAVSSGAILSTERYAEQTAGQSVLQNVLPIHTGSYFGWTGRIAMFLSSALLPLFPITGWMLYLARTRRKRSRQAMPVAEPKSSTV
jgi:sulfite reductase (NADPH) flavoprotein alpha-component